MKVLALDISTKTGFAEYDGGTLVDSGTLWPDETLQDRSLKYPFNYVEFCAYVASLITKKYIAVAPDVVVIEETTASNNNYSQKQLEYIHAFFLTELIVNHKGPLPPVVYYIRDGVWKDLAGARQNAAEKQWNAKIRYVKKKTGKARAKIGGKIVRKLDKKDYYIRAANERFGKQLTREDENEAAALLIGTAYLMGAPTCDGTVRGGLFPKKPVKPKAEEV
jgi:hypothetical protein